MNEFCDCCEGLEPITPIANANRPGLAALTYRVGTHATFLETMKARLSGSKFPALAHLKTRDANDPSIALLDAWATVADVLTFYQERIANEGYLRTATERRSVLELARLVGYTLRPGVSATVFPAFMMEIGYNTRESEVPAGTRIQSVPGPGEMPQFFETAEKIASRTDWDEIKPRLSRPPIIDQDNAKLIETLYLKGITTNLRAGDPLLLTFRFKAADTTLKAPEPILRKVAAVELQAAENHTKVSLQMEPLEDEAFLGAFTKAVDKYSKLEDFCIDASSKSALAVIVMLNNLKAEALKVKTDNSLEDFLNSVSLYTTDLEPSNALGTSRKATNFEIRNTLFLALFNLKNYSIESMWLNQLISELESLVQALSLSVDEKSLREKVLSWTKWLEKLNASSPQQILDWYKTWLFAQYQPTGNILEIPALIPSFESLASVVAPLTIPASLPPSNRFRLIRNTSDTFNAQSDLRPRLIETFNPILEPTLNQALASSDRLPALPLKTPEAMRVKAAPFGHNAPLKPVFDSNGAIVGYEDWPIATTSIRIRVSQRTRAGLPVLISLQSNAQSESKNFVLSSPSQTEKVNGVSIDITGNTDVVTFVFQFPLPREFKILLNNIPSPVTIDGDEWLVSPGQTLRDKFNGRQVVISASEGTRGRWSSISVLDESPASVSEQNRKILALDAQYDQIQPGSQIAIVRLNEVSFHQVINTRTASKTDYGISGRVTQLTLDKDWLTDNDRSLSDLRGVTIYAQGEALDLAEEPLTLEPVCGQTIELGTIYEGLKAGRWLIVSGDRVDVPNTKVSELVMLAGVQNVEPNPPGSKPYSTLTLSTKLAYVYKRDTVKIYGNVVKATHGETRVEVLGSGDGSQAFQQFLLRQPPLTYLAAPTPSGAADTLEVRVNDVLWHETDSLSELVSVMNYSPQIYGHV